MDENHTRRRVLQTGAMAGALGGAGLAGCLGFVGNGGNDTVSAAEVDYTDWLSVGSDSRYTFTFKNHQEIRENDDILGYLADFFRERMEDGDFPSGQMGIEYEDVTVRLRSGAATVLFGRFSKDAVTGALGDNGFTERGEYEGYKIFRDSTTIGIDDGKAVATRDSLSTVRRVIDTGENGERRYVDTSENLSRLVEELGSGTMVNGSLQEAPTETDIENGRFAGAVGEGWTRNFGGERTTVRFVRVFADSSDVNMEDIEAWTETEQFDVVDDISIFERSRVVFVTGEADSTDVF
jgi:hypothetical protein